MKPSFSDSYSRSYKRSKMSPPSGMRSSHSEMWTTSSAMSIRKRCSKKSCFLPLLFIFIMGALLSIKLWTEAKRFNAILEERKPALEQPETASKSFLEYGKARELCFHGLSRNSCKRCDQFQSLQFEKQALQELEDNLAREKKPKQPTERFISEKVARERPGVVTISLRARALVDRQRRVFAKDDRATKDLPHILMGHYGGDLHRTGPEQHYSWWVFPTNWSGAGELFLLPGGCDPELSPITSGVESAEDARYVLKHTHKEWTNFLKQFCDTCNDPKFDTSPVLTVGYDRVSHAQWVLGEVDYKKAKFFWQFWLGDKDYQYYKGIKGIGEVTKLYPEFHKQVLRIKDLCPIG